jgi:hypothetical protein
VRMGIVGAVVFEVAHEGSVITGSLGIEGFQALVVKHPFRHLAAGDQLRSGVGDDEDHDGAPIRGGGGQLILLTTHPSDEHLSPHCRISPLEGLNASPCGLSRPVVYQHPIQKRGLRGGKGGLDARGALERCVHTSTLKPALSFSHQDQDIPRCANHRDKNA